MSDDWEVPNSDEEETPYQPCPEMIMTLYTQIEKGIIPALEGKIHPRKDPIISVQNVEDVQSGVEDSKSNEHESPKSAAEPNEFDFDSQAVDNVKRFTRRTPSRPQPKKVARMDKVCSNIIKYQKMDEEQQQLEKKNPS